MGKAKRKPAIDLASLKLAPAAIDTRLDNKAGLAVDKHALYQRAVQFPKGDLAYFLKFYRQYVGSQIPQHLREDFCGTALLCATWCQGDVRRSATGVDIDEEPLAWGAQHNVCGLPVCLVHSDVLNDLRSAPLIKAGGAPEPGAHGNQPLQPPTEELRSQPADIVCALNFSVCLLHRCVEVNHHHMEHMANVLVEHLEVMTYLKRALAAINKEAGGIVVLDLLGGHAAEENARINRRNRLTGATFLWEQEGFNPIHRHIRCHLTLKDAATKQVFKRAWTYHWRIWTIPEVRDMVLQAGFNAAHIWLRPMQSDPPAAASARKPQHSSERSADSQESPSEPDDEGEDENNDVEYKEYTAADDFTASEMDAINSGWTAYIVAVLSPSTTTTS